MRLRYSLLISFVCLLLPTAGNFAHAQSATTEQQGQVAGVFDITDCLSLGLPGGSNPLTLWQCLNSDLWSAQTADDVEALVDDPVGFLVGSALEGLSYIVLFFVHIGAWVLAAGAHFISFALSPTVFARHEFVTAGWPFVQGLANLGFILALLAIAFATALGLEQYGARRMLPRLLLGAILINFSLLIGTIIVDASRLLMALEVLVLAGGADISNVAARILLNSNLIHVMVELATNNVALTNTPISDGLSILAQTLFAGLMIWGSALGFIILGVMFFIRYVAILLLLVLSPLAFLAIAVPRAGQLATRWWSEFLKYVFFGPAALLILIMLVEGTGRLNFFGRQLQGNPDQVALMQAIVTTVVTIILLYMAATVGRYLSLVGAAATVGFVSGKAKQAARLTGRGAALAGRGAAKGVYVGTGARRGVRNVRDMSREAIAPFLKRFGLGRYSNYDDKGQLKPGKTSAGARLGQAIGRGLPQQLGGSPEASANIAAAKALDSTPLGRGQLHANTTVSPDKLANPDILGSLQMGTLGDLIARGRSDQRQGLAAGVGLVQTVPKPKVFLDTVVNQSIDLLQQAEATINNPAANAAQINAATRDRDGAQQILRNLVKNSRIVEDMGDAHKGRLLSLGDATVNRELFRTMAQIRSREASKK